MVNMQVMEQNPKLAKQSRVLKVSMDAIYDFAITPQKDKKAEGVVFRFMPDAKEVQSALEVGMNNCLLPNLISTSRTSHGGHSSR